MTGGSPLTVILPVYNGDATSAHRSIRCWQQTYRAFDVDIWDDGSKDGTPAILDSYDNPRIRRFTNRPNKGLFPTLNVAIREARGERLRLWAYDDIMKPHCLERETQFWQAHPHRHGLLPVRPDRRQRQGFGLRRWTVRRRSSSRGWRRKSRTTMAACRAIYPQSRSARIFCWSWAVLQTTGSRPISTCGSGSRADPMGFIHESLIEMRAHAMQFSRWTGESLNFIREDRQVLHHLYERLPPQLQRTARNYHLRHRVIQYVHYMMRELVAGRLGPAGKLLAEVRQEGNLACLFFYWLCTANGRWFQPRPVYLDLGAVMFDLVFLASGLDAPIAAASSAAPRSPGKVFRPTAGSRAAAPPCFRTATCRAARRKPATGSSPAVRSCAAEAGSTSGGMRSTFSSGTWGWSSCCRCFAPAARGCRCFCMASRRGSRWAFFPDAACAASALPYEQRVHLAAVCGRELQLRRLSTHHRAPRHRRAHGNSERARNPPAALMLGRLLRAEAYKGHREVIAAWPGVREHIPGAELWIAGDGDLRPDLERSAGAGVIFWGRVPEAKKAELLALPLPGAAEPGGRIWLGISGTLRVGRPCLVSDRDAGREVVHPPEAGLAVNPTDAAAVATALVSS